MRPNQAEAAREPFRADHSGAHRLNRLQAALTVAVLIVAGGAVLYALFGSGGVLRSSPSAPGWRPGAAPCRANPLAHVHDPGRLTVVAKCATTSGIVQQVEYKPGDGDWQTRPTGGSLRQPTTACCRPGSSPRICLTWHCQPSVSTPPSTGPG
jgi:hypothetical protein